MIIRLAKALAAEVVSEAPFELIKEGTYERAAALLESCKRVICCIKDFGPVNEKNRCLAELGKHKEKSYDWMKHAGPFRIRNIGIREGRYVVDKSKALFDRGV